MTRKLPWLSEHKLKRSTPRDNDIPISKRRKIRASSDDGIERVRTVRNPSSSPPPAPPTLEFMKEGFDQDDAWIMVEDEFLATANQFTRHLHHAEYQRLKKLAKEKKAGRAADIITPTVGQPRAATRLTEQQEANGEQWRWQQVKSFARATEVAEDSDEWEDGAGTSNPRLAGLMTQKGSTTLEKLIDSRPQERVKHQSRTERTSKVKDEEPPSSPPALPSSPPPIAHKERRPSASTRACLISPPKTEGRSEFAERQHRIEARKQKQKQQEEKQRRSVKLDEIPTFLF